MTGLSSSEGSSTRSTDTKNVSRSRQQTRGRASGPSRALRPADSAAQYRDMAAALQLAAYIDGKIAGAGPRGQANLLVRSGVTGRRIASIRFAGDSSTLASDVGNGLWPRTGSKLTRLCAE